MSCPRLTSTLVVIFFSFCCPLVSFADPQCVTTQSHLGLEIKVKCTGYRELPTNIDKKVTHLDLSSNALNSLDKDAFKELTKLEHLDIYDCNVETIAPEAFHLLKRLKTLNLARNSLKTITKDHFKELTDLRRLNLSFNLLESFPNGLMETKLHNRIECVDLCHNKIVSMEEAFKGDFDDLQVLNVSDNKLKNLKFLASARFDDLKQLHLANNELTGGSTSPFNEFTDLDLLDVSGNQIANLQADYFENVDVGELNLGYNRLTQVPAAALKSLSITTLDLSGNLMEFLEETSFPSSFEIRGIETLILSDMPELKEIRNHSLSRLTGLSRIEISRNHKLTSINPRALDGLRDLEHLIMEDNGLETLQSFSLNFDDLTTLRLDGNEWRCDKSLLWMKHFKKFHFRCNSPSYFAGRKFSSLTVVELGSQHHTKRLAAVLATVFGFIALVAVLLVLWRNRKRLRSLRSRRGNPYETVATYDQEDGPRANVVMTCSNEKAVLAQAADV